jgi:hypothetical protein
MSPEKIGNAAFLRIPRPVVRHRIAALVPELATIRRDLMLNSPEAEEFFDLARYGLMLAEQMADDATRGSLLKLVRAWVAAERQATQLAGRDECASWVAPAASWFTGRRCQVPLPTGRSWPGWFGSSSAATPCL